MKSITGSVDTLPILGSKQHVERVVAATIRHGFSDDPTVVREALNRLVITLRMKNTGHATSTTAHIPIGGLWLGTSGTLIFKRPLESLALGR